MSRTTRILRLAGIGAVLTIVVVLLMAWLIGFFHEKVDGTAAEAAAPAERPVGDAALVKVVTRRVPRVESAVGTIRAVHETSVASKLLARVEEVPVAAGQEVRRGDVLARLDDEELVARLRQAEAAVAAAEAAREQAQLLFDRLSRAREQEAASQTEVDRARTELDAAVAEVQLVEQTRAEAETVLGHATIRSPIDGIVIDKQIEAGDTVTPGRIVATLFDPTRMQLVASVRESLTQHLAVGQTIGVSVAALGKTCDGRVAEIVPEAESASRTFTVKVTGPCPPGVYTGMFGRLLIPLEAEDVVLAPRDAVRRIGQLDVVDVAEGGVLRRRLVELGRDFDGEVEVLAGLVPGEMIALPGGTVEP